MGPISALIAEDEPLLRGELKDALAALWPDLVICAEAEDGIEAVHALETHAPEILFLDIQMPGRSGLEVARRASRRCHVVFVTAYDKYAVEAFHEGAVDYVMKPFTMERLAMTVERLKAKVSSMPANLDGLLAKLADLLSRKEHLRWITASQGGDLRLITVDEICYLKSADKYTIVVTREHESLIRRPIRELIEALDPNLFWQIHRGTVVNVNAISGITRDFSGKMRVKLKQRAETLPVSDPYVHLFKSM